MRIFSKFTEALLALLLLSAAVTHAEDWKAQFVQAERVFNGRNQSDCIPMFQGIVEQMTTEGKTRLLTPDEIELLSRSIDYLGQVYFNLNEQNDVRNALLKLIEINPDYVINEDLASPNFIDLFRKLKAENLASLSVASTPPGAMVKLDGRLAGLSNIGPIPVLQGEHEVEVSKAGYVSQKKNLTIRPGGAEQAQFELAAIPIRRDLYDSAMKQLRTFDAVEALKTVQDSISGGNAGSLDHLAAAEAWLLLGVPKKAREQAQQTVDLGLTSEESLLLQGLVAETGGDWEKASTAYAQRLAAHPNSIDDALRLARVQCEAGDLKTGRETVRKQRIQGSQDPRLFVMEAEIDEQLFSHQDQQELAAAAAEKARGMRAQSLLTRARLLEGRALLHSKHFEQAKAAFEEALNLSEAAGDVWVTAQARMGLGELLLHTDPARAKEFFDIAQSTIEKMGFENLHPEVLHDLGSAALAQKDYTSAMKLFESALPGISERTRATLLLHMAEAQHALGDSTGESAHVREALTTAQTNGDAAAGADALLRLAAEAEPAQAAQQYEEAARLLQASGDIAGAASSMFQLAQATEQQKDLAGAGSRYLEASMMYSKAGDTAASARALVRMADLLVAQNRKDEAATKYSQAATMLKEAGDNDGAAMVQDKVSQLVLTDRNRVVVMLQKGFDALNAKNDPAAITAFEEAGRMASLIGDFSAEANARNSLGFIYSRQGDDAKARDQWRDALAAATQAGDKAAQALSLYNLATAEYNMGNHEQAESLYKQSSDLYLQLGQKSRPKPWQ